MATVDHWQLPDGIEEVLPERAEAIEGLRRQLLDLYRGWGYRLVIPPLIDLDLLTFKLTDQLSGRALGVRADITPQVARIDAHSLAEEAVTRLCYAGSVLHSRPQTPQASRSPIQLGAELYGDDSVAADVEIVHLMLATLEAAGLDSITLDLGHVGIYRAVLAQADLGAEMQRTVFDALQRKSVPDLHVALEAVDPPVADALAGLHGDASVLSRARELFTGFAPDALVALDALEAVASELRRLHPDLAIYFDLAELRGYHYHTGLVFAAYVPEYGQALANGGRYNDVGEVFGRARPATGFATDLKVLTELSPVKKLPRGVIGIPNTDDPELAATVRELRASGEIVVSSLSGRRDPRCDRELSKVDGRWQILPLD